MAAGASGSSGAAFARALSSYRGALTPSAGDAAVAALEAVAGGPPSTAAAGSRMAATADAAAAGLLGLPGSRHLSELAPLSGLQPPAPRSRITQHTRCTAGEELYLQ
jgi:hypothetical protein